MRLDPKQSYPRRRQIARPRSQESGIVALAPAITSAGGLKTVTTLVVDAAETAVAAAV